MLRIATNRSSQALLPSCSRLPVLALLLALPALAAVPVAKTVPRSPSDPTVPHEIFANKTVTLKGTSSIQGSNIQAIWDFGDDTTPSVSIVVNQYDVSATHVYSGAAGTSFTAKLTLVDLTTGESSSTDYPIVIRDRDALTEVRVAIDEGLWYLHKTLNRTSDAGQPGGNWQGNCGAAC